MKVLLAYLVFFVVFAAYGYFSNFGSVRDAGIDAGLAYVGGKVADTIEHAPGNVFWKILGVVTGYSFGKWLADQNKPHPSNQDSKPPRSSTSTENQDFVRKWLNSDHSLLDHFNLSTPPNWHSLTTREDPLKQLLRDRSPTPHQGESMNSPSPVQQMP